MMRSAGINLFVCGLVFFKDCLSGALRTKSKSENSPTYTGNTREKDAPDVFIKRIQNYNSFLLNFS